MRSSERSWSSEAGRPASPSTPSRLLSQARGRVAFAVVQPADGRGRGGPSTSRDLESARSKDLPRAFCAGVPSINPIRRPNMKKQPRRQALVPAHLMILRRAARIQASVRRPSIGRAFAQHGSDHQGNRKGNHAACRKYRWWSPPTIDRSDTGPRSGGSTSLGTGQSFCSPRCVLDPW